MTRIRSIVAGSLVLLVLVQTVLLVVLTVQVVGLRLQVQDIYGFGEFKPIPGYQIGDAAHGPLNNIANDVSDLDVFVHCQGRSTGFVKIGSQMVSCAP